MSVSFIRSLILRSKGINPVKVTMKAIDTYKNWVRGKSKESDYMVLLKLNRNWLLGEKVMETASGTEVRKYGNLDMYCKDGCIYKIWNNKGKWNGGSVVDCDLKNKLNKILGIK